MRAILVMLAAFTLASCSGAEPVVSTPASPSGGVETMGKDLFEERVIGANPGCITCHSLDAGVTLVGPSLSDVASRVPGLSDREYVRQSILEPDAHIVDGFTEGQMNAGWAEYLTEAQVDSLVAFLVE